MTDFEQTVGVAVDAQRCVATGLCCRLAPRVFALPDDAGTAVVLLADLTDPELIAQAEQAEEECPNEAILLSRRD